MLLLQAKRVNNPFCTTIGKDEQHQLKLYSEWPEFKYKRAGDLENKYRSVLPKAPTQGSLYLLMDKSNPSNMLTAAAIGNPLLGSHLFADTLSSFLCFTSGRAFQSISHRDHWSQMIIDLLHLSADSCFNRHKCNYNGAKRLNCDSSIDQILCLTEKTREIESNDENKEALQVICVDINMKE